MKKRLVILFASLLGLLLGFMTSNKITKNNLLKQEKQIDRLKSYYNLLNQWLSIKHDGNLIEKYFENHQYKEIAIYGMGEIGNRLYEELKNTDIKVKYAIDKKAHEIYTSLDIIDVNQDFEKVDAIIVTPIFDFDKIKKVIKEKSNFPIVSLEDVIYDM